MRFDVTTDVSGALARLDLTQRQHRFAAAVALTRTTKRVEEELRSAIRSSFDKPTAWTQRATVTQPATRERLEAAAVFKTRAASKNRRSASTILGHHFTGGSRAPKALEDWLARAGYISPGEFVVPGEAARMDANGNMQRGQIAQILSQLRAGPDATQYASKSKRSQARQDRAGRMFWSRGGNLRRGVWVRHRFGFGSAVKPLLLVVSTPQYQRRIDLARIGRSVFDQHFDRELRESMAHALRTAR